MTWLIKIEVETLEDANYILAHLDKGQREDRYDQYITTIEKIDEQLEELVE